MGSKPLRLLVSYFESYNEERPSHPVLVRAACDRSISTSFLVGLATKFVVQERSELEAEGDSGKALAPSWLREGEVNFPLLILQQRVDQETIEAALDLLVRKAPEERQLGAQVLREMPSLDSAPQPHSQMVIDHLEKLVQIENDRLVLQWGLSAIGWQCMPEGTTILLSFAKSKDSLVRLVVADNLLMGSKNSGEISLETFNAAMGFIGDECEDVQWSILFEIAEQPSLFASKVGIAKREIGFALVGASEWLAEQANRALLALDGKRDSSE